MKTLRLILALLAFATPAFALNPYSAAGGMAGNSVVMSASKLTTGQFSWPGGIGVFSAEGTWNGATLTLQFVGPDGATLITAGSATTLTANGAGVFYLPKCLLQATVSSAGASTSLTASIGLVQASPR